MLVHGVMKIAAFFCAGAIIVKAHKNYVYELEGFGKKMPKTFAVFTISALSLTGVPGFAGFISKWKLATAAVNEGTVMSYIGIGALLVSALLTAIYMFQIILRAYYPVEETDTVKCDPTWRMMIPLTIFSVAIVVFGFYSEPIVTFLEGVAGGLI